MLTTPDISSMVISLQTFGHAGDVHSLDGNKTYEMDYVQRIGNILRSQEDADLAKRNLYIRGVEGRSPYMPENVPRRMYQVYIHTKIRNSYTSA